MMYWYLAVAAGDVARIVAAVGLLCLVTNPLSEA